MSDSKTGTLLTKTRAVLTVGAPGFQGPHFWDGRTAEFVADSLPLHVEGAAVAA